MKICILLLQFICVLTGFSVGTSAAASSAELSQAQALASFYEKDFAHSLAIIESGLSTAPNDSKLLELKALNLKAIGRWKAASEVYQLLSEQLKQSPALRAPYEFELGFLEYTQKRHASAEPHLLYSIQHRFNVDVAKFILASIHYEKRAWMRSQSYLKDTINSAIKEVSAQSHLFLGQMLVNDGGFAEAFRHLVAAREIASQLATASDAKQSSLESQILTSTEPLIASLDKRSVGAQIGLVTAYDSNVLLNPTSNADPASQQASFKETLFASLRYSSSSVASLPWQLLYQASGNYNLNPQTRSGQFIMNDLGFNLTLAPDDGVQYGVKTALQYILRSSSEGAIAGYSGMATIGPFIRSDSSGGPTLGAEVLLQGQGFLQDPDSPASYRKSGWGGIARFYRQGTAFLGMKTPTLSVFFDLRQTAGEEFRSKAVGVETMAMWRLSQSFSIVPQATLSYTAYQFREAGYRGDWFLGSQLLAQYQMTAAVSISAGGQVAKNFSTIIETYEYLRFAGSLGVNVLF